jgi:hypothetical protein
MSRMTPRHRRGTALGHMAAWFLVCASACTPGLEPLLGAAGGPCAAVRCVASDACHRPGSCDAATGRCGHEVAKDCGSTMACDLADGQCHPPCTLVSCRASDLCHVAGTCDASSGRCGDQAPVDCPAGQGCDPLDGLCRSSDRCAQVTCAATDRCHHAGSCDPATGSCSPQSPLSCAAGLACSLATGLCGDACAGVTCTATDPCHHPGSCSPATGACSTQVAVTCATGLSCSLLSGLCVDPCAGVSCPTGQSCDPLSGQCHNPLVAEGAKLLGVSPVAAAVAPDGAVYVAGGIVPPTQLFDGQAVTSAGDFDLFLARYDGTTRTASWAFGFGDAAAQQANGLAVTQDGTVVTIGSFSGTMTIGNTIASAGQIDFLAGFDAGSGAGRWAKQFNDGANGNLKAVATNPGDGSAAHGNRIAVCGRAAQAATDLVGPGAGYGGASDLVIAMFRSDGTRLWAVQVGGSSNEECDAVALDANGDLYAAGNFSGTSLAFGGGAASLVGPGTTARKFLWVARFDGTTGAAIAAASFSGPVGQVTPTSLAFDATGNLAVGGSFTSGTAGMTMGSTTLTSAGAADAFLARLSPALVPAWAVRLGGTGGDVATSVAFDSLGDLLVTGFFNRTSTGAAALTATGTASDAFLLKIDGATGATRFASGYGDGATQTGDSIAVNRFGVGSALDQVAMAGTLNGAITFPAPAGTVTNPSANTGAYLFFASFAP